MRFKIVLYFPEPELTIEFDEKGYTDRDVREENKRGKKIKEDLGCKFTRVNPDKKDFDITVEIDKIHNHIIESTKKSLIDKISKGLLELNFKSNYSIITKALKRVVKRYCHHYETWFKCENAKTYCFSCKNFTYNTQKKINK